VKYGDRIKYHIAQEYLHNTVDFSDTTSNKEQPFLAYTAYTAWRHGVLGKQN
jgi:hypothetical protein